MMVWSDINPNNNFGTQRFPLLDIPTKYQYLTCIIMLIPMGKFFGSIIDIEYWLMISYIHLYTIPTLNRLW